MQEWTSVTRNPRTGTITVNVSLWDGKHSARWPVLTSRTQVRSALAESREMALAMLEVQQQEVPAEQKGAA